MTIGDYGISSLNGSTNFRVYYKDAVGAFLVFDVTRSDSFHAVEKWKVDLDSKVLLPDGRPIPCVLLGNKSDVDPSMHASSSLPI